MAQLIISAVGAAAGFAIGGPIGMNIGWALGSMLASSMAPAQKVQGQQQQLMDLRITGTEYGQPIPYIRGSASIAGQIWWNTDRRPTTTTTTTSSGGKGGGGGVETTSSTITYDMDMLIGVSDNPIIGIARIWNNGALIYTAADGASAESIDASASSNAWRRLTVYTGSDTQLPDPTYEAAVGLGNAPAYRGRGTVFIEGLQLGQSGQVPNLTFEVVADGGYGTDYATYDPANTAYESSGIKDGRSDGMFLGPGLMYSNDIGFGGATMRWSASVGTQFHEVGAGNPQWFCEFYLGGNEAGCGMASDAFVPTVGKALGADAESYGIFPVWGGGYFGGMFGIRNGISFPLAFGGPYGQGTFGMQFDANAGTIRFWYNGVDEGVIFSGLVGNFAPAGMVLSRWGGAHAGVNFGQLPWAYPPHGRAWSRGGVSKAPPTVASTVAALCDRAGLLPGQIDVTALSSITRKTRSLAVSQITTTRATLELLMSAYFFEMTVSDKIYFRPRGGAPTASIPYLDLGASKGTDRPEPLELTQQNELEVPAQIALTYINLADDYQNDTQYSDRLISATSGTVSAVQMALGMTPDEAKTVADAMIHDQAASVIGTKINVLGDYCRLEPTDTVTVTDHDGSAFRLRLVTKTDSYPLLQFEAVVDDASVLTSSAITSADYISSNVVVAPAKTVMELFDVPILRDTDNDQGFYCAARGDSDNYPGSAIFSSADNVEYAREVTVNESAVLGVCTTTLGDWSGRRVFDETNSVTVDVGAGVLTSTTRDAVLNSLALNAMLIGSEMIQFCTATLVSDGVYKLTTLLRGCRGTEWAMTGHASNERCVLLRGAGLRRIHMVNGDVGLAKFYKGVTLGAPLSSAVARAFTNTAIGLKPFSPVLVRAARDVANNVTIEWARRSRMAVRTIGALGINVPLGETWEKYRVEIFDSTFATRHAAIQSDVPRVSFPGGAVPGPEGGYTIAGPVGARICQLSETVGAGYPLDLVI